MSHSSESTNSAAATTATTTTPFDGVPTIKLNDGHVMPLVGLGVYRMSPSEAYDASRAALKLASPAAREVPAYRLIDTAAIYRNEEAVGRAVRESGVPRERVFVTTKLWVSDYGEEKAYAAFQRQLDLLGLPYIDLFLMHWPAPVPGAAAVSNGHKANSAARLSTWRALERLVGEGRVRSIGVSNFNVSHLEELLAVCRIRPAVNQVELHPRLQQRALRAFCAREGIVITAYDSLGGGDLLRDPAVLAVVNARGGADGEATTAAPRTVAQVLLRWALDLGVAVLPKSVHATRIEENANVLSWTLSAAQKEALDALDDGTHYSWDPTNVP